MSIVRVSALKSAVYGVTPEGAFVHGDYDRRRLTGRTETLKEPSAPGQPPRPGRTPPGFPGPRSDLAHLLARRVRPAIERLDDGPVVVMVHGFLFEPRDAVSHVPAESDNPHARIYHFQREVAREVRDHTTGWPVHLGFEEADETGESGLALAFGWHSQPGFAQSLISHFQNFYARAYENAETAAWNLATCLHELARLLPEGKRIDLFCHSLGSRVVIRCIAQLAKHLRLDLIDRLDRVIILGGAEYVVEARHMLQRLAQVGRREAVHFYNVVSRENDVLDKLGENFGPRTFGISNVIGHNGLDVERPEALGPTWLDLQIDGHDLARWMRQRDFAITGDNPESVWDHWYYYTDHGNMALYNAILRRRPDWDIPALRGDGIPDRVSRRRSVFGD